VLRQQSKKILLKERQISILKKMIAKICRFKQKANNKPLTWSLL
jgi:hypothetical protein